MADTTRMLGKTYLTASVKKGWLFLHKSRKAVPL